MPGYLAPRDATVWLQIDQAAQVALEYWPEHKPDLSKITPSHTTTNDGDHTAKISIGDLEPGTTYAYRVMLDGAAIADKTALRFRTSPLWRFRKDPPAFEVALGSCAYVNDAPDDRPGKPYGGGFEIFGAIAKREPELMLWLGDNLYFREADFSSPQGLRRRYRKHRRFEPLQALLRGTHHIAIWDDHDYGMNDANQSFIFKDQSLKLFKQYWANPSYGHPRNPGIYTTVRYADVDFFLLDGRSYRVSDREPFSERQTMFGQTQIDWLKDALLASKAAFKIIAGGSQFLDFQKYEGWQHFRHERDEFLQWLSRARIEGVVFLSGDRHLSKLLRVDDRIPYPLYELTCSPLTASASPGEHERVSAALVPSTLTGQRNFCTLAFSGPQGARKLTISAHSTKGDVLWSHEVAQENLRHH